MTEVLAPLMFLTVLTLIFAGYPVAFSLGGVSLIFAGIAMGMGVFDWPLMYAFPERVYGVMSNTLLLGVPYFILMGSVLEKSRLAEDLLRTIGRLFGPMRGGLGLAVVFVGTLLAAATGVVGASVVAMGTISLPVMLRYRYDPAYATGIICASGTLGQIIPPSVVLVVLADQLGVSVGALFAGSLGPGLMLSGLFALYTIGLALFRPEAVPALPLEERGGNWGELLLALLTVMFPPLLLIVVVLGSIFMGIATPTEAGALGALGAILLAVFRRRLSRDVLETALIDTARLTTMVAFLLIGSTLFALVFRGLEGDKQVVELLTNLPGGKWGLLIIVNLLVFILGFFIDFFEIAFILLPLVVPAAKALQIDMVWFGVLLGMNLQTSFLTPPFGFALFYLRGVMPAAIPTTTLYRGVIPFIVLQIIGLIVVMLYPDIVKIKWY